MPADFRLTPRGPFSLSAAARFGRAFTPSPTAGGEADMALAFAVEQAGWRTVGVHLVQEGSEVLGEIVAADGGPVTEELLAATRDQVARILSLDVDGTGFPGLGRDDPVVAALQARYPGLRPVLFHSPYEAAAWTIIGQRIRITQAARVKAAMAERLGLPVTVGGASLHAFPAPAVLAGVADVAGLTTRKHEQLRHLAHAALDGALDAARLRASGAEAALAELQRLPGIGPFAADLVLVRGAGEPDHFPAQERRLHGAMRDAYELPEDAGTEALAAIAERWRPYRSWVALLLRTWLEDRTSDGDARPGS